MVTRSWKGIDSSEMSDKWPMRNRFSVQVDDERNRPDHLLFSSTTNATLLSLDLLEDTSNCQVQRNKLDSQHAGMLCRAGGTSMW